jgi:hypothetical protein
MKGSSSYVARSSFTSEMDSRAITPSKEELFVAHLDDIQLRWSPHMSTLCCETPGIALWRVQYSPPYA